MCCKISKVEPFLQHFLCVLVNTFCFVIGLGCHYSHLHFKIQTQNTLAINQVLQQHFQCHSQYYSRLTVSVCKHTAALCTATSVLLLLGVPQCCNQHSVPDLLHYIRYRTGILGTYHKYRSDVNI